VLTRSTHFGRALLSPTRYLYNRHVVIRSDDSNSDDDDDHDDIDVACGFDVVNGETGLSLSIIIISLPILFFRRFF